MLKARAGIYGRHKWLLCADDICLLASSLEQLQALIDALAPYCATLRMETTTLTSVPKTKVMVVSAVPAPAVALTCNDNPVEQVATFKYLGLHFHQSGSIAHLVTPVKARAAGSWAAVQWFHSLLQCGNTISLHLHLLQFWCLPYNMGVRSGVCTAFALLLLTMLVLHCSACMVTTSESFAVFCFLLLAGFC